MDKETLIAAVVSGAALMVACGGIGAAVDFYIGTKGQEKVRSWVEHWWLYFSEMKPRSIGQKEAQFAASALVNLFGRHLSIRRLYVIGTVVTIGIAINFAEKYYAIHLGEDIEEFIYEKFNKSFFDVLFGSVILYVSISLTVIVASFSAKYIPEGIVSTFLYFISILLMQAAIFNISYRLSELVRFDASQLLTGFSLSEFMETSYYEWRNFFRAIFSSKVFDVGYPFRNFQAFYSFIPGFYHLNVSTFMTFLSILIGTLRLGLALLFVLGYLLRPAHSFIETIWLRIVEQNKPVFTFVFAGLAAIGKFIQEAIKLIF